MSKIFESSQNWDQAEPVILKHPITVSYAGGIVKIPKLKRFFIDSKGRILIGFHGTYNPPMDMSMNSMIPDFLYKRE